MLATRWPGTGLEMTTVGGLPAVRKAPDVAELSLKPSLTRTRTRADREWLKSAAGSEAVPVLRPE